MNRWVWGGVLVGCGLVLAGSGGLVAFVIWDQSRTKGRG